MIERTFRVVDGHELKADVHRPRRTGPVPAILWVHGGALIMGRRGDMEPAQRRRYLEAGWAVVMVDHRLAPETSIEGIVSDIDAAWAWSTTTAASELGLDPGRLAMVGHSAGAYLVLARGPHVEPRPRALVSWYGYGDVAGSWYTQPSPTYLAQPAVSRAEALRAIARTPAGSDGDLTARMPFYVHCRQQGTWPAEVLGVAASDPGQLQRWCPERGVPADHPPTLLLHGDEDDDVPVERSRDMAAALRRARIDHELVIVPGAGHGFDRDANDPAVASAIAHEMAFLRRVLD